MNIQTYHRFAVLAEIGEVAPIMCDICHIDLKVHPWDTIDGEQIVLWCPGCSSKTKLGQDAWDQIESVVNTYDNIVRKELYG
jgi:hypothetical protein